MRTLGAASEVTTVPCCKDCLKANTPLHQEDEGKYLLCNGERVPLDGLCGHFRSAQGLLDQMDVLIEQGRKILEEPHE